MKKILNIVFVLSLVSVQAYAGGQVGETSAASCVVSKQNGRNVPVVKAEPVGEKPAPQSGQVSQ